MDELQKRFLALTYTIHFIDHGGGIDFNEWAEEINVPQEAVHRAFDELDEAGLLDAAALGPFAKITSAGILFVEKNKLVEADVIRTQQSVRTKILDTLARVRDEHGARAIVDWEGVAQDANVASGDFSSNSDLLEEAGHIEFATTRGVQITTAGYKSVQQWREKTGLSEQFFALRDDAQIRPQARGHALEKILEELAAREGWKTERNVRSPGEETDIILSQDFNYFLVSCKWEKSAVETKDIRDLHSRISARPSTRGILFSMSGFSENAIGEAKRRMESAVLLLFGPQDIADLFRGVITLTNALHAKLHAAMTRRQVIVDQEKP